MKSSGVIVAFDNQTADKQPPRSESISQPLPIQQNGGSRASNEIAEFQRRHAVFSQGYIFPSKSGVEDPTIFIEDLVKRGGKISKIPHLHLSYNTQVSTKDDAKFPSSSVLETNVRRIVAQFLQGTESFHHQVIPSHLPLVQPRAATARHLFKRDYLWTPKVDGDRVVLFISDGRGYFTDRFASDVVPIELPEEYKEKLLEEKALMMDGELIKYVAPDLQLDEDQVTHIKSSKLNDKDGNYNDDDDDEEEEDTAGERSVSMDENPSQIFIPSDIQAVHTYNCNEMKSQDRVLLLKQVVSELNANKVPGAGLHIVFKEYVPASGCADLFATFQPDPKKKFGRYYLHPCLKAKINVDLLIGLEIDKPYQCKPGELIKYKKPHTADFKVASILMINSDGERIPYNWATNKFSYKRDAAVSQIPEEIKRECKFFAVLTADLPSDVCVGPTSFNYVCIQFTKVDVTDLPLTTEEPTERELENQKKIYDVLCKLFNKTVVELPQPPLVQGRRSKKRSSSSSSSMALPLEGIRAVATCKFIKRNGGLICESVQEVSEAQIPELQMTCTHLTTLRDTLVYSSNERTYVFPVMDFNEKTKFITIGYLIQDPKITSSLGMTLNQGRRLIAASRLPSSLHDVSDGYYGNKLLTPHPSPPLDFEPSFPARNEIFMGLAPLDTEKKLKTVVTSLKKKETSVMECYLDRSSQQWEILRPRKDKSASNFHSTAIDVLFASLSELSEEKFLQIMDCKPKPKKAKKKKKHKNHVVTSKSHEVEDSPKKRKPEHDDKEQVTHKKSKKDMS